MHTSENMPVYKNIQANNILGHSQKLSHSTAVTKGGNMLTADSHNLRYQDIRHDFKLHNVTICFVVFLLT